MSGYLRPILVCLILGAVTTLGFCLVCAWWITPSLKSWGNRSDVSPWTAYTHLSGFGIDRYRQSASNSVWPGLTWSEARLRSLPWWVGEVSSGSSSFVDIDDLAVGWPLRCLRAHCVTRSGPVGTPNNVSVSNWEYALVLSRQGGVVSPMDAVLPLRPLVGGLVADVLIWAAAWGISFSVWSFGRSALRRRRHRCPACGYPIGSSPVCTECGHALRPGDS